MLTETAPVTNVAQLLYTQLRDALKTHRRLAIIVGKLLSDLKENDNYQHLGEGGYDTFAHFLQQSEIGLSPTTANAYMDVYRFFVLQLGMTEEEVLEIPINRLITHKARLKKLPKEDCIKEAKGLAVLTHSDYVIDSREKGIQMNRPDVIRDSDTGKWIVLYNPETILFIQDKRSRDILIDNRKEDNV